ncbi:unnamed protein product [Gongylonema pulchrum]|uniref:Cyanocobalamin reductase (cyanide-eliminating) n=1 Tax=Gongylonema pulchrum TaxID=637853 RepID=A0A3P7PL74_9BILA|nr:unnamed protein product [Gongylonema pulchrum]
MDHDDNAMAVLVLNNPFFFENAFKKWLLKQRRPRESAIEFGKRFGPHPIRDFFLSKFADIEKVLAPISVRSICDFEPVIHRPPVVSLPLCGEVSGAAYFYQPNSVIDPKTNELVSNCSL